MDSVETAIDVFDMHDLILTMRDLATSLLRDPIEADILVRRAMHRVKRLDLKDPFGGEDSRNFLRDLVVRRCLEHLELVARAAAYVGATEDDDDGDDIDDEWAGESDSGETTIFGEKAAYRRLRDLSPVHVSKTKGEHHGQHENRYRRIYRLPAGGSNAHHGNGEQQQSRYEGRPGDVVSGAHHRAHNLLPAD
jgi:hypothetical protein